MHRALEYMVSCDVCGEEGPCDVETSAAGWLAGRVVAHTNPGVCADNLRRRHEQLDARDRELEGASAKRSARRVPKAGTRA